MLWFGSPYPCFLEEAFNQFLLARCVASAVIDSRSGLYQKGIDYQKYMNQVKSEASVYQNVSEKQVNMIMLSTCYTGTENRYVVYGQLKENVKR